MGSEQRHRDEELLAKSTQPAICITWYFGLKTKQQKKKKTSASIETLE